MQSSSEPKSLQICQDDKFLSKLLSREKSIGSSGRVYYAGVSGSVPFNWEAQPGFPRKLAVSLLPDAPLTPPPAYQTRPSSKSREIKTPSKDASSDSPLRMPSSESLSSYSSSSFSGKSSRSSSDSGSLSSSDEKVVNAEEEVVVSCKCSVLTSPTSVTCFGSKKWSRGRKGAALEPKANMAKRGFF